MKLFLFANKVRIGSYAPKEAVVLMVRKSQNNNRKRKKCLGPGWGRGGLWGCRWTFLVGDVLKILFLCHKTL